MTVNAQTMLELADDIADIPHEVNLTPRQARLLQEAANRLRETAALPPSQEVPAQPQCAREARQVADCIRDYLQNKYGTAAVQISTDGIERIYYSGIPLNDLAAALSRPETELCPDWRTCKCKDGCAHTRPERCGGGA